MPGDCTELPQSFAGDCGGHLESVVELYTTTNHSGIFSTLFVPVWFLGTLGIAIFLPQRRTPKAFIRFGICTAVMLIYYMLFDLHATFDMAHQQCESEPTEAERNNNLHDCDFSGSVLDYVRVAIQKIGKHQKIAKNTDISLSLSLSLSLSAMEGSSNRVEARSYWRWSKKDFFPEESFKNWGAYRSALSQTCPRLKDRLLDRSDDSYELDVLRLQSENDMKRCLTWWDLMWIGFGAVVGTGIFVLTGQEARNDAGPSIVLSYAAAGLSALLSVFCYAEFAVEIPVAGGSFSYLRVELGDFAAFIAAGNILLESLVGAAGLARSWTSYFATLCNLDPNSLRIHAHGLAEGFNFLDPIAVVVLITCSTIAMVGTQITSRLNWITSVFSVVVILFVIIAGSVHADASNLLPFFPFGIHGTFKAAAVVYWAYTGFDMVATLAEETKNPPKDIPLGLVGSMSIITVMYCVMALVLCMMQRYSELDVNAAYSIAFASVGMKWAKYLVALGALKGMTTGLLVGSLGQGRYTTQIARAHMIPPAFALVHPKTGTPIYATLLVTICSACIAFFSSLDVLATVSSISTLFIFMLMAVALLVRRYYAKDITPKPDLFKLLGFLSVIIGSSIGLTVYWSSETSGWIGYAISVPLWFLGTLGIAIFLPQRRTPKVWGVPLVPWLPSLSIAMNLFLMGSLGYQAFIRFGICTAVMLIYYLFFGLHATFDVAHDQYKSEPTKVEKKSNVGVAGS
ncbi:cationic amino acid transporter 5-like [Magnolia sinica]|uniref:cationic amino acid transporter 5-like n=1 Tax=Magnolia sinica TaxID=86752 RepID=UPI00265A7E4C|nr:cationic amino acid transporter 5-like [Magnolia sinica]